MDQDQNHEPEEVKLISPYQVDANKPQNVTDSGTVASSFFTVFFEVIKTVIIVGVLALLLRLFIVQPFIVEGLSMSPALDNSDYLLIDKITYRFHQPKRGDIIVFHYPKDERLNYIKRVIGLPGETVQVTDKAVIVTNSEYPNGFILDEDYLLEPDSGMLRNKKSIKISIPENEFFVMGDNRLGSSDSREWGLLPKKDIIGRSFVRLFPIGDFQTLPSPEY